MKLLLNLWIIAAATASAILCLALAQHFLGKQHVYYGLVPAFALSHLAVNFKYWVEDKLDEEE